MCTCVTSRPAAMAVISLAFGQYILEPLFMPCDIPPLAVKLATAIGLSMFPPKDLFPKLHLKIRSIEDAK